jgi:UDP-glucose:(heptosyl)LPS alpha-1,3-glucosyltransferase
MRMKIALNIEWIGARRGGAEKYAGTVARALSSAGHEVHVVARGVDTGELPENVTRHEVRLVDLPGLGWSRTYRFAAASARLLAGMKFDLVVGFNKTWHQDVYLAVAGAHPASIDCGLKRFSKPLDRTLHALGKSLSPKQWLFRRIDQKQFHGERRPLVVAPSRFSAGHFREYHGLPPWRIETVYNGIDPPASSADRNRLRTEFRRQHNLAGDQTAVLFSARNYELKGLAPLLEAFAQVAATRPSAVLVACGSRRDEAFRRQAAELGIADRVRFLGFVDDVAGAFAGCDLFAFPTFYDPCSLVVLEAMHAGLPVITTRTNGASELITSGRDGIVVSSADDVEGLALRLATLCDDAGMRADMGAAAARKAAQFTIDARLGELLAVLERAAGCKSPRTAGPHVRSTRSATHAA